MEFSFILIHFDDFDLPPWSIFTQLSSISSFVYSSCWAPFCFGIFIQVFARAKDLEIMDMPEVRFSRIKICRLEVAWVETEIWRQKANRKFIES